jgi:hypothetical protein
MSQVIDKKLFDAIDRLNEQQKKEVLLFVGNFLEQTEPTYDKWEEESFVTEMDSRYDYYKNGGKMISVAESENRITTILAKK